MDVPVKITGLDLSMTATGVCTPDGHVSTIRTRTEDGDRRLLVIEDAARIATAGSDLVVVENWLEKSYTAAVSGMVHGAVRRMLLTERIPYVLVPPATLKKFATGNGNCNKTAMAVAAMERFGLRFKDDNQCDAFWLQKAALTHYGLAGVTLPAVQRAALKVVAWP